jgi:hypothetical protein
MVAQPAAPELDHRVQIQSLALLRRPAAVVAAAHLMEPEIQMV